MAKPEVQIVVDWDIDGLFTGTGEDITSRVLDVVAFRGRDYASQLTGRSQAGILKLLINNESGDYSSFNTGSPIAGLVLPARKVQLQLGSGSFPYTFPFVFVEEPFWTGYVLRIEPQPFAGGLKTVILDAIGPLGHYNQRRVYLAMGTSKLTGTSVGEILDEAGVPAADRSIDTGQTTMNRFWVNGLAFTNALRKVEETESGFVLESKDGKIVFEDRHHRLASPHTTSQTTFSDAGGSSKTYSGADQEDPLPNIFNIFEAKMIFYTVASVAVAWTHPETGASSPKVERDGGTRTFLATFPNPDSANAAVAINAWTTPIATTDFLANSQAGGGGDNLTGDIGVSVVSSGNQLQIILTNNNASQDAFMTFLQARGTIISASDPVKVTAENAASKTAYGERTFPNPGEYIPDTQEAQDWADFNLAIYKDPVPIISIVINGNKDDTHMFEVLARDISERITLVGTGNSGLGVNEDFFIEAVAIHIQRGGRIDVTWALSPAVPFSDFWVLGTSALDTQTRLAY